MKKSTDPIKETIKAMPWWDYPVGLGVSKEESTAPNNAKHEKTVPLWENCDAPSKFAQQPWGFIQGVNVNLFVTCKNYFLPFFII